MRYKTSSLPEELLAIIDGKGTERPFSGFYNDFEDSGTYLCRRCGLALFRSETKFHSGCGWPSFDEEIGNAVAREEDMDGRRTEILCKRCRAHLGHVFLGEGYTPTETRHCVNSLSLDFVKDKTVLDTEEAIFAAGCFWGVEYYFKKLPGVLKTEVGYCGGSLEHPTYHEVCRNQTGHYESIRVVYDPTIINYEKLTKFFFEIHDPTQTDGQGPDKGEQYLSVVFYFDEAQKDISEKLIQELKGLGYGVATQVLPVAPFWPAEDYHQGYYQKNGKLPYCHHYQKKFK